jgi:hypothetical protein
MPHKSSASGALPFVPILVVGAKFALRNLPLKLIGGSVVLQRALEAKWAETKAKLAKQEGCAKVSEVQKAAAVEQPPDEEYFRSEKDLEAILGKTDSGKPSH